MFLWFLEINILIFSLLDAYVKGATDELNSHIGLSREYASRDGLVDITAQLEEIMSRLFDVGASIATPLSTATEAKVW